MAKSNLLAFGAQGEQRRFTRRRLLSLAVAGTLTIAGSTLLEACGGDSASETPEGGAAGAAPSATAAVQSGQSASPSSNTTPSSGTTPSSSTTQPSGSIELRITDNLLNMDPALITSGADYAVANVIYSSLVRHKPGSNELIKDLAESWEVSPDGLTFTFKLRDDVKWQKDYGEFSAQDVVYSFTRIKDKATGSRYLADLEPISSITAVDKFTVEMKSEKPYPALLDAVLAYRPGFIVNQQAIEKLGKGYINGPIGTGPYVFDSWRPSALVEVSANPDYYGDPVSIEKATFHIVPEDTVAEIAIEKGEIDGSYFEDPEVQQRVSDNSDLHVIQRPMPRSYFVYLNLQRKPFDDLNVRKAIAHAIDKESIVANIFLGQGEVAHTPVNPNVFGFLKDAPDYEYDVDKAKALLADAGHPDGFPDQTFEFVIDTGSSYPEIAQAIQSMVGEIGIKIKISVLERALYEDRRHKNDYDLLGQTTLRVEPSQILVPYFSSSQAPYPNINGYSGADELIDKARFESDDAKRAEAYYEAQRQIMKDLPAIPLLYPVQVLATRPGVEGANIGLLTYPLWQLSLSEK